jgi:hypothetical protein
LFRYVRAVDAEVDALDADVDALLSLVAALEAEVAAAEADVAAAVAEPKMPSTYNLVVASALFVGVPKPVILAVPIAIAPLIVPPVKDSFNASAVSTYTLVAAS